MLYKVRLFRITGLFLVQHFSKLDVHEDKTNRKKYNVSTEGSEKNPFILSSLRWQNYYQFRFK